MKSVEGFKTSQATTYTSNFNTNGTDETILNYLNSILITFTSSYDSASINTGNTNAAGSYLAASSMSDSASGNEKG